jgi:uncharacterized protein
MKKQNIIRFILLLFYAFLFISPACNKNTDNVRENSKLDTVKKQLTKSIQFVKQGEVYFQDKHKNLTKEIDVEIADTEDKRHIGLMYRDKMDTNQGMLFIFPNEEEQAFYMKNTILSLDIIFINAKKQIVKIYKRATPFDITDLPSKKPILYVVEVLGGFTDRYNIKEGDYIDFRKF